MSAGDQHNYLFDTRHRKELELGSVILVRCAPRWDQRQEQHQPASYPPLPLLNQQLRAEVAQLVEHSPEKAGVDSSILSLGTTHRMRRILL